MARLVPAVDDDGAGAPPVGLVHLPGGKVIAAVLVILLLLVSSILLL